MIKCLRMKFVCVVMTVAMLMFGMILGVVVYFTGESMELECLSAMHTIASKPPKPGPPGKPSGEMNLPHFRVEIGSSGELIDVSGGQYDVSDQDYVMELVQAAMGRRGEIGELKGSELRYLKRASPRGYTLVFVDISAEHITMRNLAMGCLVTFVAATAVFLCISILLARWAVRPVEEAWEQQRQFVADASHELKTPLSVIMANAELMQSEEGNPKENRQFAGNILTMSYQMRALVENMLEMARVDNGNVKMRFAPLDMSQLVSDAVLSVQLLFEEQGLVLCSQVAEGIILNGSEQHLFQVMDVLLDNALKYSASGGQVMVSLRMQGKCCLLSVTSPGEPLSGEELKKIFKRFYRADKARTMNGSYGLGLSIAESIVNAHKGRIWAESGDNCNHFFVQLPAAHEEKNQNHA